MLRNAWHLSDFHQGPLLYMYCMYCMYHKHDWCVSAVPRVPPRRRGATAAGCRATSRSLSTGGLRWSSSVTRSVSCASTCSRTNPSWSRRRDRRTSALVRVVVCVCGCVCVLDVVCVCLTCFINHDVCSIATQASRCRGLNLGYV